MGHNQIPEAQMLQIIAMERFDVLCAVPVKELKENSITEVDLAGQSLGVEGALVLAEYIKHNNSVITLDISNNQLVCWSDSSKRWNNAGIDALGKALAMNRALCSVAISDNNIGNLSVKAIAAALTVNNTIIFHACLCMQPSSGHKGQWINILCSRALTPLG